MQSHSDELIKIKETLSTSYIGEFPGFLSKINEIIQTAKEKISIVCDVPGYGIFSSPRLATEYRNRIRTKCSEGVSISLMYYSKDRRSTNFQEQFDKTQWEEWRAESENLDKIKSFINRYARNKDANTINRDEFIELLENSHIGVLKEDFNCAELCPIKEHLPIHFWLVDGKIGFFSIPSSKEKITEHGFLTQDKRLLDALNSINDRYLDCVVDEE